jgi:hypothetical protein
MKHGRDLMPHVKRCFFSIQFAEVTGYFHGQGLGSFLFHYLKWTLVTVYIAVVRSDFNYLHI